MTKPRATKRRAQRPSTAKSTPSPQPDLNALADPSAFAPFAETELQTLAAAVANAEPEERSALVEGDFVGGQIAEAAGDADRVVRTLMIVWGEAVAANDDAAKLEPNSKPARAQNKKAA